jgi:hypothetical protein
MNSIGFLCVSVSLWFNGFFSVVHAMSIPVLIETYNEARRLAIAGSIVAPGDFRLKKLVPQLEQAGKKAPVFAKVGEAVNKLVESNDKTSAAALLDLTTLITAILYTQGETGLGGELAPIKTINLGRTRSQVSGRVLKPLREALTTTGSGRLEIIQDAFERGVCHDFRLVGPALTAIDDPHPEIAEFVAEKILPLFGQALVPELQATFDPKGKSAHVRRLLLIHQLDPESSRPFVQRSLDEGSKEVRIAAISCLGDSPEDLPFLLEQVKAKGKDVRTAALTALGRSSSNDAARILCAAIESDDLELAVEPLRSSRNPVVTGFLLDVAEKQFDTMLAVKEKDKKKNEKRNERMCLLLDCLREREDPKTEKLLLKMFSQGKQLGAISGGMDVFERLVDLMVDGPPAVQSALVESHEQLPVDSLGQALIAAYRSRPQAEVFRLFSPYFTAKVDEKKKLKDPAYARREVISEMLQDPWELVDDDDDTDDEDSVRTKLDPQWLDLAVKMGHADLVQALARPGHVAANKLLAELSREKLKKSRETWEHYGILETMTRVEHPDATDLVIEILKRNAKSKTGYMNYWIYHLIPRLPKAEALPKLEALLPTLPETMVDLVLDGLQALK